MTPTKSISLTSKAAFALVSCLADRKNAARVVALALMVFAMQPFGCQGDAKPSHPKGAEARGPARGEKTAGACSDKDREKYVHDPNAKFIEQLRDCSNETWARKSDNVACLAKAMPSLSSGCAGCFATMASCSMSNCKAACLLSRTSKRCVDCANENCQESLIKCTGVARANLP